jgi:perosamine synthetase
MTRAQNDPNLLPQRREFLKSAGAMAAGVCLTGTGSVAGAEGPTAVAKRETLAINGGPKAVTVPAGGAFRWPLYGNTEKEAIKAALDCDSGSVYQFGPRLEAKWREYTGVPFAKTHMNGTSAITSMFFALDLPPGSEILTPSYTFFGAILPMRLFGYVPVFVDINPRTATFNVEHARKVITPNTRALVAMHSWGLPCEMDLINDFAKEHNLIVMEDCAHAHGASMQGKKVGNFGQMGIYSFQATKPLPGIEGGMGVYQKREHFERATAFGHYEECGAYVPGSPSGAGSLAQDSPYRKYTGTGLCMKLRMHPLAAVLVTRQLEVLDKRNALIKRQVRKLNDRLCQLPGLSEPVCRKDQDRVYYSSNQLFLDEKQAGMSRATVLKALQAEGVNVSVWEYPENHKCAVYSEPQWWHHPPQIPKVLPGCQEVNSRVINAGLISQEAPELVEQYIKAFEKVWAHRKELA